MGKHAPLKLRLKIKQLYEMGENPTALSREYGIPYKTLSKWCYKPIKPRKPRKYLEELQTKIKTRMFQEKMDILARTERILEVLDKEVMEKAQAIGGGEAARSADFYFRRKQLLQDRPTQITKNLESLSDEELRSYIEGEYELIPQTDESRTLASGETQGRIDSPETGGENPLLDTNSEAGKICEEQEQGETAFGGQQNGENRDGNN